MENVIRLLPYEVADGARNMAADESLVRSAAEGIASLRFYGWTTATVSLGYFQPAAVRLADSRLATLPWVRRPSGGAALVHHHELTYAIALPHGSPWHSAEPWMPRMHRIITRVLADLGLRDRIEAVAAHPIRHGDILCFQQHTVSDLLCVGNKVVGSAQRKYRQALMQHGSILMAQSEHTPDLPGIKELSGIEFTSAQMQPALIAAFVEDTGWEMAAREWTAAEQAAIRTLVQEKYGTAAWNEKR